MEGRLALWLPLGCAPADRGDTLPGRREGVRLLLMCVAGVELLEWARKIWDINEESKCIRQLPALLQWSHTGITCSSLSGQNTSHTSV